MQNAWIIILAVAASLIPIAIMAAMSVKWSRASKAPSSLHGNALYADRLIQIWPDYMVFLNYYFPTYKSKWVRMDDIERIWKEPSTLRTGKWRIHGSGDFRTWYPQDCERQKRDRIFFATLRTQRTRIGFTVERPEEVEMVLKGKGFLET